MKFLNGGTFTVYFFMQFWQKYIWKKTFWKLFEK